MDCKTKLTKIFPFREKFTGRHCTICHSKHLRYKNLFVAYTVSGFLTLAKLKIIALQNFKGFSYLVMKLEIAFEIKIGDENRQLCKEPRAVASV